MALILFSITSIGMILEANRKAYLIEIGRLLFTVVFYVLMLQQNILHDPNYFGLFGLVVFALGSTLIFISMRKTFAK